MLGEILASELCDHVRGRFLPIAAAPMNQPVRGDEPVGGRWWVRDCRTRVINGQTAVYLQGVGWAWAEGSDGMLGAKFAAHDYVYFDAAGTVVGHVDASFDSAHRVAWMQFRPTSMPFLNTAMTNRIETHGNLLGAVASAVTIGILGDHADDKANELARATVSQAFQHKLATGFILTFDLAHRQLDTTSPGTPAPLRPFSDDVRWLVNEQQVLHARPGAMHVNGPYAPTQAAGVDVVVLKGALRYRAECERDVVAWLDPATRGIAPSLPPPMHNQAGTLSVGAMQRTISTACPWYLITEPATDETVANVRVHANVSPYSSAGP